MSNTKRKPERTRRRPRRVMKQMSFAERLTKAGNERKKPGPKARPGSRALHRRRAAHASRIPLHITMRAISGLPSFRRQTLYVKFEQAVRNTRRPGFHIVEYSIQDNHLHLIVEADSKTTLARGMVSFSVRANRLFNSAAGRGRGRVWADRYHRRDLTSPRQVRNALVYCLNNWKKHQRAPKGDTRIDLPSSAQWFSGWNRPRRKPPDTQPPNEPARQYLLTTLWKRHGLIDPSEAPKHPG